MSRYAKNSRMFGPSLLAMALAVTISGNAFAQTAVGDKAAAGKELQQARADLERAAARVAELSRQQGLDKIHRTRVERVVTNKPVIGVLLAPDDKAGVRIAGVTPDGSAAKAGIKSGDRLISVNGQQILGSTAELRIDNSRRLLGALDDKSAAKIGYERAGRTAIASVTPQRDERVMVWKVGKPSTDDFKGAVFIGEGDDHVFAFDGDAFNAEGVPGIAPEIRNEIIRIGPDGCKGKDCKASMLMSAFRWNGLNLASMDKQLGRYFGTDTGVLVLSTGELDGLQAGDVIQRIDGKQVDSPRDVMATLRGKSDDAKVAVDYLRDRKSGRSQITVPKLRAFPPPPPMPPVPPVAPVPPKPPKAVAPPPPPPPPPKVAVEQIRCTQTDQVNCWVSAAAPTGTAHQQVD